MKSYEEWSELRNSHLDKARAHMDKCREALDKYIETHDFAFFREHLVEYRLHNKHWGIAQAMYTRRYGR